MIVRVNPFLSCDNAAMRYFGRVAAVYTAMALGLVCLPVVCMAADKLLMLPFRSEGMDPTSVKTAQWLLSKATTGKCSYSLVTPGESATQPSVPVCADTECAVIEGVKAGADRVFFAELRMLGKKVLILYSMVEVRSRRVVISDTITSLTVEDLEIVMDRVATSVCTEQPVEKTIEFGTVTKKEGEPLEKREAFLTYGIQFGYLLPVRGYGERSYDYSSYPYDVKEESPDRVLAYSFQTNYEMEHMAVTSAVGLRQGISYNLGFAYLPYRTDFTPFFGAGLGFHWVNHGYYENDSKKDDGMEVMISGGIMAFRTYNFRLILQLDYTACFNSYGDQAVTISLGVLTQQKEKRGCLGL